jgi:hypothetical protein
MLNKVASKNKKNTPCMNGTGEQHEAPVLLPNLHPCFVKISIKNGTVMHLVHVFILLDRSSIRGQKCIHRQIEQCKFLVWPDDIVFCRYGSIWLVVGPSSLRSNSGSPRRTTLTRSASIVVTQAILLPRRTYTPSDSAVAIWWNLFKKKNITNTVTHL